MKSIKKFVLDYIDVLLFAAAVLIKVMSFGKQLEPSYFSAEKIFLPVAASVLLIISISILFKRKRTRSSFLFLFNLLITVIIIGDITYFSYFKDVISIPVLINGIMLGAVNDSVGNLFNLSSLWYGIDLVTLYPLLWLIRREEKAVLPLRKRAIAFGSLILISCIINGVKFYDLSVEQPRLISTLYNKVYIVKNLGAINYHLLDAYNTVVSSISRKIPVSQAKEDQIRTFLNTNSSQTGNYKGIENGKNLIVIQVEALQQFVINRKVNGQEITPNLNKLVGKSLYFDNYYYQIADGGTSDAEFLSNNSLYPAASGSAYFLYAGNKFHSLSNELDDSGYYTAALHGYKETFWNRNVIYKSFGFDKFYSEDDYNIDEVVGLGLSDESFLDQTAQKIQDFEKPYYAFAITLSSHFPYDDIKDYGDFDTGDYEGTFMGDYLKSIHYTDAQLGTFLDELEANGTADDSVIAVYGDHSAITRDHADELYKLCGITEPNDLSWIEQQKVPMIIHLPDESLKGVDSSSAGQVDFYPTIANLMGIEAKNVMGRDLLNSIPGEVIFRDGSFISEDVYYKAQDDIYYDMKTGQVLQPTVGLLDKKADVLNKLNYSDNILKHDLFKKFD
ncbi:MAG TPA: LTA synthase family protein [Clostridiaceae bacterium]